MNIVYSNALSAEDYCVLRKSVDFYPIPLETVKSALEKSDYVVSASEDGVAVGMGRLITDGTQVLIMDVVVHPDYQGTGIGKGIMQHIMRYIEEGYSKMLVNLLTDDTKVEFYEKFGFQKELGMRVWHGM